MAVHKDRLTCDVCGKLFRTKHAMYICRRAHRYGPVQKSVFVCTKCGETFFMTVTVKAEFYSNFELVVRPVLHM